MLSHKWVIAGVIFTEVCTPYEGSESMLRVSCAASPGLCLSGLRSSKG